MMGGDRINDVEFNTNQMKREKNMHEQDKDGEWNASTNRSGKMAFILIYRNHVQKSICANNRENMGEMEKSEKPHR